MEILIALYLLAKSGSFSYFLHAAHAKASLIGSSISIPITDGKLNLGHWQVELNCRYPQQTENSETFIALIPAHFFFEGDILM